VGGRDSQNIDRDSIDDVIDAVSTGGDPRIAPALDEALRRVLALDVSSKHIILLADGRMEERTSTPSHWPGRLPQGA
jgi:hypothetical protein